MWHALISASCLIASTLFTTCADAGWFSRGHCAPYYCTQPCEVVPSSPCIQYEACTTESAVCTECVSECGDIEYTCSPCESGVPTMSSSATVREEIDQIRVQIGDLQRRVETLEASQE